MNTVAFVEQSISDLRLSLLSGEVDESLFKIVTRRRVDIDLVYSVELVILAESHFWTLYARGRAVFSELFACHNQYQNSVDVSQIDSFREERDTFVYTAHFDVKEGLTSRVGEADVSLMHTFGDDAVTKLLFVQEEKSIAISSLHLYPNENRSVVGMSHLEFVDES
jgi:hypothetical protein